MLDLKVNAVSKIAVFAPAPPVGALGYRCYLFDKTGRLADTQIFGARDDKEAAAYAFALFIQASNVYERFEVWNKYALVHAYKREVARSDERHQPQTQGMTPSDGFRHVWRVDEKKGRSEQASPTLSPTLFAQRNGWIVTLRGLAIAFAVTVGWILMFDATLLKLVPAHSPTPSRSAQISHLRQ